MTRYATWPILTDDAIDMAEWSPSVICSILAELDDYGPDNNQMFFTRNNLLSIRNTEVEIWKKSVSYLLVTQRTIDYSKELKTHQWLLLAKLWSHTWFY